MTIQHAVKYSNVDIYFFELGFSCNKSVHGESVFWCRGEFSNLFDEFVDVDIDACVDCEKYNYVKSKSKSVFFDTINQKYIDHNILQKIYQKNCNLLPYIRAS